MSRFALALVPFLTLAGGCNLFSAETSLDNVCVQLVNRTIDGVPTGKLVRTFSYSDLGIFDGFISLNGEVTDLVISLKGVRGVSDLSFLDSVHVSIASTGLEPLEILACDDGACASTTTEASVHVDAPPNLVSYALSGNIKVTMTVTGPLPKEEWGADVSVCLSGTAQVKVGL